MQKKLYHLSKSELEIERDKLYSENIKEEERDALFYEKLAYIDELIVNAEND